jgi:DNA-binding NarL/FixJ family response regulator
VLNAGASGYLLKDTPPREIIQAVRETAEGRTVLSPRHARVLLDRYSRDGTGRRALSAAEALSVLTEREREMVAGVTAGLTNPEIAAELHCSPATVKAHLGSIFTQLGINNRVSLAILGHDAGLIGRREGHG